MESVAPSDLPLSGLNILYQDEHLLAVDKPAGTPVHGSRIFEDCPQTLQDLLREQTGEWLQPVHRLDRAVSGVNLFARNPEALAAMGHAFEDRLVGKSYLAVCRGWTAAEGTVDHALKRPRDERKAKDPARPARTAYRTLGHSEQPWPVKPYPASRFSLVALFPETGRRHQLRRHLKHLSHPIIGDTTYGRGEYNRLFRDKLDCHRLLLHSAGLHFRHPVSGQDIVINALPGGSFLRVVDKLGWSALLSGGLPEPNKPLAPGAK